MINAEEAVLERTISAKVELGTTCDEPQARWHRAKWFQNAQWWYNTVRSVGKKAEKCRTGNANIEISGKAYLIEERGAVR